jgi:hypothetical protein
MIVDAEIDPKLRNYVIKQMLQFLQFLLNLNEISDSNTYEFDAICKKDYYDQRMEKFENLWDIIFIKLCDGKYKYTTLFSAYCRKYNITTKKDMYIHMSESLETWVDRTYHYIDKVILTIGMSTNENIQSVYDYHLDYIENWGPDYLKNIVDALKLTNLDGTTLPLTYAWWSLNPIQIEIKYDDPLQQLFYAKFVEFIIRNREFSKYDDTQFTHIVEYSIQDIITDFIDSKINFKVAPNVYNKYFQVNGVYLDYDIQIPQYPPEIKPYLIIMQSLPPQIGFYTYNNVDKLAKLAELSGYNLSGLPLNIIDWILYSVSDEQLPGFYNQISHRYSGSNTKIAPSE